MKKIVKVVQHLRKVDINWDDQEEIQDRRSEFMALSSSLSVEVQRQLVGSTPVFVKCFLEKSRLVFNVCTMYRRCASATDFFLQGHDDEYLRDVLELQL